MPHQRLARRIAAATVCLFIALGVTIGSHAEDKKPEVPKPKTAIEAAKLAAPLIKAARKGAQKDKEAIAKIKQAMAFLAPFSKDIRKGCAEGKASFVERSEVFSHAFNEALTVSYFHGLKPRETYVMVPGSGSFGSGDISCHLPYTPHWDQRIIQAYDQENSKTTQKRPSGDVLRKITLWQYRWDTTYSGVGGENYKKLAKVMHELDRGALMKKGRKASGRVKAKKLSKNFPRAQYYYVEGFDVDEEKKIRSIDYYIKGDNRTFNIDITCYIGLSAKDDAVTAWQCGENDPETRAFLESIKIKKKKKR